MLAVAQQAPALAAALAPAVVIAAAGTWRIALLALVAGGAVAATRMRFAIPAAVTVLCTAAALTALAP